MIVGKFERATHDRQRSTGYNSTYPKGGVSCFADSFGVAESLVLRINICGENRHLLVAAKRYALF